jgi:hypothetical protein
MSSLTKLTGNRKLVLALLALSLAAATSTFAVPHVAFASSGYYGDDKNGDDNSCDYWCDYQHDDNNNCDDSCNCNCDWNCDWNCDNDYDNYSYKN